MKQLPPLLLLAASAQLLAEQTPMEHVLVSVPVHKKVAETALPVTVLSGDELQRQAAATIGDTLANSPGLANASFGPAVGQPVIRGQAGPRVTVLQNGTSSADAANVSADHAVSVEPLLADSIEVLRGPATLLYGGGAIGGVVNVVDNRIPTRFDAGIAVAGELRHDSASDGTTAVGRVDAGRGSFAWHLDGLYHDWNDIDIPGSAASGQVRDSEHEDDEDAATTDGHVANTDGRSKSLTIGGAWHFDDGFFGLAVNRLENAYGIPPGAHEHHEDITEAPEEHKEEEEEQVRLDIEQTRYDAAVHVHEPLPGLDVFRGFFSYTDYRHVELEGDEVGTRYRNDTWETRLEMVHSPWGKFHGSFGLQSKGGEFSAIGEESFIPTTDSSELGLFLVEDYHGDRWTVEGGLRLDRAVRDPESTAADRKTYSAVSLSGSLQYDISDAWQLGLSLMRAERAPAIEELYSNVANDRPEDWIVHAATRSIELGDPGLDTEVSNNADLSTSWLSRGHSVTVTAFYNDFSNYITLVHTGLAVDEVPVYAYANEGARFYGVEVDSEFSLLPLGSGELLLELSADAIRGTLDDGSDVPRLPPRRLGAKLRWSSAHWNVYGGVLDAAGQDRPGVLEAPTAGYTRWDAGLEYRLDTAAGYELVVFANLKNLTDEEIRLSTSFLRDYAPEPGRSLEGGLRLQF